MKIHKVLISEKAINDLSTISNRALSAPAMQTNESENSPPQNPVAPR